MKGGVSLQDTSVPSRLQPRSIHLWAARQLGAGRRDAAARLVETGPMKKRLLISALVFAALLLLALYGVMFGTGAK
jgi:hypothetical protein